MQDSHKILIDIEDHHKRISSKTAIKAIHGDKEAIAEKEGGAEKESEEKTVMRKVKVTNLESGKFYFFQLIAGFQDVDGSPTEPESIFVDGLPQPPPKPLTVVNLDNTSIVILSELGSTTGSPIESYRLYHSVDSSMEPKFLIDEISANNLELQGEKIKFVFSNAELRLSHYFNLTAVNKMGESISSDISDKCVIDYVPNQPSKPIIKKLSATSLQISSTVTSNGGSDVDEFTISMFKLGEDGEILIKTNIENHHGSYLEHVIDGLEPETAYEFQVVAKNVVGSSIPSEKSDSINLGKNFAIIILDALVPVANSPQIQIINSKSVKIIFPNISTIKKPAIKNFRISWSPTTDFNSNEATTITCPSTNTTFVVEDLPESQSLYFGISLVGESSGNSPHLNDYRRIIF